MLYRGFFKGVFDTLYAKKNLPYTELYTIDSLYIEGKLNEKKGFIWCSEKTYVLSKSALYRVTL